jgi:DNA replication and repair protein RecF
LVWVRHLGINDLRNISEASLDLHPGLNIFCGRNAQGKTSLLEAVGFVARGRSFRTENAPSVIRRGASALHARAEAEEDGRFSALEVRLQPGQREFRVDGRHVTPREYHGRLEVAVYSTDRLRIVRGPMRERRQFLDRSAGALWPAYRAEARAFERVLSQRNAALQDGAADLSVWTERFVELGARLRVRRAEYAARLDAVLRRGFSPAAEAYEVFTRPTSPATEGDARAAFTDELVPLARRERALGRSLAGPHRDTVELLLNGRDAALEASSGQARSLLLALVLASLEVYREETGRNAVALLDDLDSELDHDRTHALCTEVASRTQALVTSAHAGWAESLRSHGQLFQVSDGQVLRA